MNEINSITRRRFMMATGSAIAMLGVQPALAQQPPRLKLTPDEFQPIPIAIPNFVPGSPASNMSPRRNIGGASRTLSPTRSIRV